MVSSENSSVKLPGYFSAQPYKYCDFRQLNTSCKAPCPHSNRGEEVRVLVHDKFYILSKKYIAKKKK
jgi:hypothetical protein